MERIVSRYVDGVLQYCLTGKVETMDDLAKFMSINPATYGVTYRRLRLVGHDEECKQVLSKLGFSPMYVDYSLKAPFDFKPVQPGTLLIPMLPKHPDIQRGIGELVKECASRDGRDFSSDGTDPSWFTLGSKAVAAYVNGELAAFRVFDYEVDGKMKLWMAYVYPKHRKQGYYTDLLHYALNLAKVNGVSEIRVSTDSTDNPMHYILKQKGFEHVETSYIEDNRY